MIKKLMFVVSMSIMLLAGQSQAGVVPGLIRPGQSLSLSLPAGMDAVDLENVTTGQPTPIGVLDVEYRVGQVALYGTSFDFDGTAVGAPSILSKVQDAIGDLVMINALLPDPVVPLSIPANPSGGPPNPPEPPQTLGVQCPQLEGPPPDNWFCTGTFKSPGLFRSQHSLVFDHVTNGVCSLSSFRTFLGIRIGPVNNTKVDLSFSSLSPDAGPADNVNLVNNTNMTFLATVAVPEPNVALGLSIGCLALGGRFSRRGTR